MGQTMSVHPLRLATVTLIGLALGAASVSAQEPKKSEIRGTVVKASDRTPIAGARISLEGHDLLLNTDGKGRFKFPKVAAGTYVIRAEVEGFPSATSTLVVAKGDRVDVEFQVGRDDAVTLPELTVTEANTVVSPVAEFNRRATTGNGQYLTREFIEKRAAPTLSDLLRGVPGVRTRCPRSQRGCVLTFSRHAGCSPAYFIDGLRADPVVLNLISPTDIEGVELYSGPSETPPELEGFRSACGAIAIWTRVGEKPEGD
jgi:hypothetical protein